MAGVASIFENSKVVDHSGNQIDLASHCAGKTVGIYFSAHWCPPCRGFTPVLAQFYNKHKDSKNFEIIFVSSDKDKGGFDEYFVEMPWLGLDYVDREKKGDVCKKFGVRGIPMLVLLNGDTGDLYTTEGRENLQYEDTDGENFPWNS